MSLVNAIYQNRSTWPVRMHDWSKQKYLIYPKQKHVGDVSNLQIATKSQSFEPLKPNF